ncbi:MAG: signal peptidase I [Clostridia bacterium]|nr:signal peptidase I [Clostridia bacterium]MBQ4130897.1 signal peptidase I [Clostridia bacterium]MBQ9919277.1 signal peptidase I [Clostridia bacterium]
MSQKYKFNGENEELFFGDGEIYEIIPSKSKVQSEQIDVTEEKPVTLQEEPENQQKKSVILSVFEWLDVVVASVVVVVLLFTFVFRMVRIDGDSMNNTLIDGERVVITDMFYTPKRGDIVVISRNTENSSVIGSYKEPIIKRVIATEGDIVDIDFNSGIVYVNNEPLNEPYIKEPTYSRGDVVFPLVVKENCVFVLGDNRNDSKDSRSSEIGDNGQVDVKYILGRAVLRVFPLSKFGGMN